MVHNDIDKAYISPYDKLLHEFDVAHEKSHAQLEEINKHRSIALKRDNPIAGEVSSEIWRDF